MNAPADYTIRLAQVFQGPLDLLLHLVREQEVEIQEVNIARIIEGYFSYLEQLESLDIEVAAEFLVMAATLMAIKSRSLLPHEELDLEDELDPEDELIQRLIEYRRFKSAADDLEQRHDVASRRFPRGFYAGQKGEVEKEYELGELTSWDLLSIYSRLMRETLADQPHQIASDPRPLRYYVDSLVARLRRVPSLTLQGIIDAHGPVPQREALIGSFCALLELVRMELVEIDQAGIGDDIAIRLRPEHAEDIQSCVERDFSDPETLVPEDAGEEKASEETGPEAAESELPLEIPTSPSNGHQP